VVIDRFDRPARAAVEGAYRAATELEHNQVGTEHLLLGILAQADTSAAAALVACGASLERCRVKVAEAVASKRPGTAGPELTFTDRANLALERASRLSLRQRCDHVEVRHILLSVLDVEGTAGQVLRGLAVDPGSVRQRLNSPRGEGPAPGYPQSTPDQAGEVVPRCAQCRSNLDSTLAHRVVGSRDPDGVTAQFLLAYCSKCGCTIAGIPA
jgi:ATP-dependent Clp protease ATP-binding subunit ClpC